MAYRLESRANEAINDCCHWKHRNGTFRRDAETGLLVLHLANVRWLANQNPGERADRLNRAADRLRAYILKRPDGRARIARSESILERTL